MRGDGAGRRHQSISTPGPRNVSPFTGDVSPALSPRQGVWAAPDMQQLLGVSEKELPQEQPQCELSPLPSALELRLGLNTSGIHAQSFLWVSNLHS